jgi:GTP-binding protein EngB required for normal cell division
MSLRDYEQDKFEIAEILRSTSRAAPSEARALHAHLHDLFVRLAEDRFNLVVVGRFNRGKTSIMNAILGSPRLPVGIVPLTSVITTVSYGTTEHVVLRFDRSSLTSDVPLNSLSQYVTQHGNPGNIRGIKIAEVKLRAEILRRGFHFVDTPGLGSAIAENTLTTEAFLSEADAFLMVTSYESPLTEEEIGFLRSASLSARRIFVVLNKHDTVTSEERQTIVTYVRDQLRAVFGETTPQLFSVAANEGLNAKKSEDSQRLSASGIQALENALVDFLLAEKKEQFLQQMCRRVADAVRALSPTAEADGLAEQIRALSERLARSDRTNVVDETMSTRQQVRPPSLQQLDPCEICNFVNDALWNFECKYQHEISVSHHTQRLFAASGGLCTFHTWQYHAIASPYGICTAYPTLLDSLARWFREGAGNFDQNGSCTKLRPPVAMPGRCILCDRRTEAESKAISTLVHRLSKQSVQTLNSLSAICIPHLTMMLESLQDRELVRRLMNHQAALLERISEDMRRYTLKHDATRRYSESKEEAIAAERALLVIAGLRDVTASSAHATTERSL